MKTPCVMVIDAGTGSARALVFDTNGGQMAAAQREWVFPSIPQYPGSREFDTAGSWRLICDCIREASRQAVAQDGDVAAVTATSMREGMVLYDAQNRELWACPNIDARAASEADELVAEGLAAEIYETAGDWLGIISPPRFRWLHRHRPETLDTARQMSMISDWVLFKLCGEIATDPSSGSSSGLFDLRLRRWSETLAARLGLPPHLFPPVLDSGTVLGSITRGAAAQTGLREGLPVVTGGADTQLALLGSNAPGGRSLTVVGGTFWQTAWISDRPLFDPQRRLRTLCHAIAGQWMTEGIGFLNGLAMRWLRETVFVNNIADNAGDPYERMEKLAAEAPIGSRGITAIVSDVMNAQCWIQPPTSFFGMDIADPLFTSEGAKGALVRAVEESAAFTARAHYEILETISGEAADRMVFCGGAAKGKLWPRIMADVFDLPVQIPVITESTSLGGAFCALVALGHYASPAEAAHALVRWRRTEEPHADNVKRYQDARRHAKNVLDGVMEWVKSGRIEARWRAPGAITAAT